ncbi:MAG: succinate dehydrogenase assembly factor 2 family protein [Gammaproteobacteria bacterium]|nr:MAG: succinate dehydrogenase assembly factor 2 family protein [Gammaproteobacteria bacterium]
MLAEVAKLRWRCRRGMRELDAILTNFLQTSYESLSVDDKVRFEALLELPDPELHAYLLGRYDATDANVEALLSRIRTEFHS